MVRILGRYTFLLSDGQSWSARCLKRFWEPSMDFTEVDLIPIPQPEQVR